MRNVGIITVIIILCKADDWNARQTDTGDQHPGGCVEGSLWKVKNSGLTGISRSPTASRNGVLGQTADQPGLAGLEAARKRQTPCWYHIRHSRRQTFLRPSCPDSGFLRYQKDYLSVFRCFPVNHPLCFTPLISCTRSWGTTQDSQHCFSFSLVWAIWAPTRL